MAWLSWLCRWGRMAQLSLSQPPLPLPATVEVVAAALTVLLLLLTLALLLLLVRIVLLSPPPPPLPPPIFDCFVLQSPASVVIQECSLAHCRLTGSTARWQPGAPA